MTSGPDSGDGLNVSRRGGWRRAVRWSRIECADEASRLLAYCPHAGERRLLPAGGRGGPSGSTQPGAQNLGAVTGHLVERNASPSGRHRQRLAGADDLGTSAVSPILVARHEGQAGDPAAGREAVSPLRTDDVVQRQAPCRQGGETSRPRGRAASRRCTHVSVNCPPGPTPGGENRRCALLRKSSTSSAVVRWASSRVALSATRSPSPHSRTSASTNLVNETSNGITRWAAISRTVHPAHRLGTAH